MPEMQDDRAPFIVPESTEGISERNRAYLVRVLFLDASYADGEGKGMEKRVDG